MERRGSGLKKILKEYESENLPEFYSDKQYFTVTLMNKNYVQEKTTPETTPETTPQITSKNEARILALIKDKPNITGKEIENKLGDITLDGIKYNLKKLKDKGIIRRIGPNKGGYWQIEK